MNLSYKSIKLHQTQGFLRHIIHSIKHIWGFPKIGVPQNVGFVREIPTKMDALGIPLFQETSIFQHACVTLAAPARVNARWH